METWNPSDCDKPILEFKPPSNIIIRDLLLLLNMFIISILYVVYIIV